MVTIHVPTVMSGIVLTSNYVLHTYRQLHYLHRNLQPFKIGIIPIPIFLSGFNMYVRKERMTTSSREVIKGYWRMPHVCRREIYYYMAILLPIGSLLIFQPKALEEVLRRKRKSGGGISGRSSRSKTKNIALGRAGGGPGEGG